MIKIRITSAVTLVEVLVSFFVLTLVIGGVLFSYVRCLEFIEVSKNISIAVQAAESRMELVKATTYDQIVSIYNGVTFDIPHLNGIGLVYVDNFVPDLLEVIVVVSWRNKNGRIYGEDANLNGVMDAGEDLNSDLILNSPVELKTRIFKK